jgi:DNA-binding NarL/FixJ family response regulator
MPSWGAYARMRAAEASLIAGDRDAAGDAIRAASALAASVGAAPLQASIEALARRGRLDLERTTPPAAGVTSGAIPAGDGGAEGDGSTALAAEPRAAGAATITLGLSPRELEVLALVAAGRTNGQIARELFISPKTAGVHVTHILDKLGVNSRVEAAIVAARAGIVDASAGDEAAGD